MKLNKLVFLFLLLAFTKATAQNSEVGNFMFPIKPGLPNSLTANMGELRSNHFHAGYDVKTDGRTGLPVYASEDGYVSRIKVSSYGYGNVVYITHANNLQTVYAHLDKFNSPISDYILRKQYEQQTFTIELFPGKTELVIKKGEIIGLAGNSGSSQGPHLHFEFRDTTDKVLNPSKYGFKEIIDNLPPVFQKIGLVPLDITSRINGEFSRQEFTVIKSGTNYTIPNKILVNGLVGIELKAVDKKNNAYNTYGINVTQLYIDGKLQFTHDVNTFTFAETRYINEHINYPLWAITGKRFEKVYASDGNILSTYSWTNNLRGRLLINDNLVHKVKIVIKDDFGIESSLIFDITGSQSKEATIPTSSLPNQGLITDIFENTLKITTKCPGDPLANIYIKGSAQAIKPSYMKTGMVVYLYDLRKGLPDSVKVGGLRADFHFKKTLYPSVENKFVFDNFTLTMPPKAIADTVFLQMKRELENGMTLYNLHNKTVSLYDSITIGITPLYPIEDKSKAHIYSGSFTRLTFEGGKWTGNKIETKTKNFGKFTIAIDTVKPTIRFISNYGNSVQFKIGDDLSGIKNFKATLNGYWLLMNYDHKRNLIWSERLDKRVPLRGDFKLEVTDNAGNVSTYSITL